MRRSGTLWPLALLGVSGRIDLLGGALRACASHGATELADELLNIARLRPDSAALPALVARWSWLTTSQRTDACVLIGADWREMARYVAQEADTLSRANLARALGEAGPAAASGADTLVDLLCDGDAHVSDAAESALCGFITALGERRLDGSAAPAVASAAARAVETFDRHRRTGVLRLGITHGMIGGHAPAHCMRWMNDPTHPAHMVLRGVIRKSQDPAARGCAWVWLKHPTLATACAERLARPGTLHERCCTLERSHLWLNPARLAGLRSSFRVDEKDFATGGALPRLGEIESLSVAARRGLPAWLEALPIADRQRDAAAAILLTDQEPTVRRALVNAMGGKARPPSCLLDLIFDVDESIASSAADAVLSRSSANAVPTEHSRRLTSLLSRSVHEPLRHCAAQVRIAGVPKSWTPEQVRQLAQSFRDKSGRDLSPREVASAVASLARPQVDPNADELAARTLLDAVELPDARIRANAIEGLLARGRRGTAGVERAAVIEIFVNRGSDPHHRIRSNAARGLLVMGWASGDAKTATAGSALLAQLLSDQRVMHRVAGLWLAHRVGPAVAASGSMGGELLDRVAFSQRHASDPMERAWGSRTKHRLEGSLRQDWSLRAPTLSESAA